MDMHPTISELLAEVDAFIKRHSMTATDFGRHAVSSGNLYRRLKDGKDVRLSTLERIRTFMREHGKGAA